VTKEFPTVSLHRISVEDCNVICTDCSELHELRAKYYLHREDELRVHVVFCAIADHEQTCPTCCTNLWWLRVGGKFLYP
jgi:hypothetical protein